MVFISIFTRINIPHAIEETWHIFLQYREGCIEVLQHTDYRILLLHSELGTLQGTDSVERTTKMIYYLMSLLLSSSV